jgi:GH18 family chitinase
MPAHQHTAFLAEPLESRMMLARVVGYFPEYRWGTFNNIDLGALTNLNYFSVIANANGSLNTTSTGNMAHMDTIVAAAHAQNVKVSVVIDPGSAFTTIAASPSVTNTFINNITAFCTAHNLDGIDLDWEPSHGSLTDAQINNYGALLTSLRAAAPNLLLSAAVNPERVTLSGGGSKYVIPVSAVNSLDWVNVMGYDLDFANHSQYTRSTNDLVGWYNYAAPGGATKSQFVLGVPFYGRAGTSWGNTVPKTYTDIVNRYAAINGTPLPANVDSALINFPDAFGGANMTWWFNGINTIQSKANFVVNNGYGGVMIWELGQDHLSGGQYTVHSLLPAIEAIIPPDSIAPTASNGLIDVDAPSQSVKITFSENVSASLLAGDLQILNLNTGTPVPANNIVLAGYDTGTNTATFTFTGFPYNALPDANYQATLAAGSVADAAGNVLAAPYQFNFFTLAGDANRTGSVNSDDFNILATNFGLSGKTFSESNFNYDPAGLVNSDDFNILATNFGVSAAPPSFSSVRIGAARQARLIDKLGDYSSEHSRDILV